jgi:hypothetical protein
MVIRKDITNIIYFTNNKCNFNGTASNIYPIFPKSFLENILMNNGGKKAKIKYNLYLKNVRIFWIINGIQFLIAILSMLFIKSNILLLVISFLATLILIISSIIILKKLKLHLANAIWYYNENVML